MTIGKLFNFFQSKQEVLINLASAIDHDVPYYRIHGAFPENGLPIRGNFDRITIESLFRYLSGAKPFIAYGGTSVLEYLFNGFLKDKQIENGKDGLVVGIAQRAIEISTLHEPLLDHCSDLNPDVHTHEVVIESLPPDRIIAYITDLKDLLNGEVVKNHFAEIKPSLPPTVTLPEIQDSDFVRSLWEEEISLTIKNQF